MLNLLTFVVCFSLIIILDSSTTHIGIVAFTVKKIDTKVLISIYLKRAIATAQLEHERHKNIIPTDIAPASEPDPRLYQTVNLSLRHSDPGAVSPLMSFTQQSLHPGYTSNDQHAV